MSTKIVYRESYKRPYPSIKEGLTPICRHQAHGFDVHSAHLLQAGVAEVDGARIEFQDIRVFFKERTGAPR